MKDEEKLHLNTNKYLTPMVQSDCTLLNFTINMPYNVSTQQYKFKSKPF